MFSAYMFQYINMAKTAKTPANPHFFMWANVVVDTYLADMIYAPRAMKKLCWGNG